MNASEKLVQFNIYKNSKIIHKIFKGCYEVGYSELDCILYPFPGDSHKAREDCKKRCTNEVFARISKNISEIENSIKID